MMSISVESSWPTCLPLVVIAIVCVFWLGASGASLMEARSACVASPVWSPTLK